MLIACDVDGVVADLTTVWFGLYNADYDDVLAVDQVTEWDTHKFVKPECGKKIYEYLKVAGLYDDVLPFPQALAAITALRNRHHRVVFVTSTPPEQAGKKYIWLVKHGFLDVERPIENFVEANDKSLVRADLLVDDAPHNLAGFIGQKLLFDAPHNRKEQRFPRARHWGHVLNYVMTGQLATATPRTKATAKVTHD